MLDPNHIPLTAEAVGFRVSHGLPVDWGAFSLALQQQSETIKTRKELKETPISEIHVMGGQMFGYEGNSLTKTNERQARQMNGYRLRSFTAGDGPIVLPSKSSSNLVSAIPIEQGLVQYNRFNAVVGNYVSRMVEPMQAPLENNTILQARAGYQALSSSATNPYGALKFKMGIDSSLDDLRKNDEKHKKKRDREIQNREAGRVTFTDSQEIANQVRRNITLGTEGNPMPTPLHYDPYENPNPNEQFPRGRGNQINPKELLRKRREYEALQNESLFIPSREEDKRRIQRAESAEQRQALAKTIKGLAKGANSGGGTSSQINGDYPVSLGPVSRAEREAARIQSLVDAQMADLEAMSNPADNQPKKSRKEKFYDFYASQNPALGAVLQGAEAAGEVLSDHVNLSVNADGRDDSAKILEGATEHRSITNLNSAIQPADAVPSYTPGEIYGATISTPKTPTRVPYAWKDDPNSAFNKLLTEKRAQKISQSVNSDGNASSVSSSPATPLTTKEKIATVSFGSTQTNSNQSASGGGTTSVKIHSKWAELQKKDREAANRERWAVATRKEGVTIGVSTKQEVLTELAYVKFDKGWSQLSTSEKTVIRKLYDKY